MFRDVPECSGMFHVLGFIDAPGEHVIKYHWSALWVYAFVETSHEMYLLKQVNE